LDKAAAAAAERDNDERTRPYNPATQTRGHIGYGSNLRYFVSKRNGSSLFRHTVRVDRTVSYSTSRLFFDFCHKIIQ
jgi:hypothetical protein